MARAIDFIWQIGDEFVKQQSIDLGNAGREMLSPFDVPRFVRVWHDVKNQQLHIEFKYLTPDEPKEVSTINNVVVVAGKTSKKVFAASVSKVTPNVEGLKQGVDRVINALLTRRSNYDVKLMKDRTPYWTYSVASDFLASKENDLLAEVG